MCWAAYVCGFHSSRFSQESPGFLSFKELCRGVPQISARDPKCPGFFQVLRIQHFLQCVQKF
jgi:hypothetical protein